MKRTRILPTIGITAALFAVGCNWAGPTETIRAANLGIAPQYVFQTIDNPGDPTFNQLLGINDSDLIAGYFGSGTPPATHPNKGYVVDWPYTHSDYTNENYPKSQQTQVTGINAAGNTVGFWADTNGDNFGFTDIGGKFTSVSDPSTPKSQPGTPVVNQLLGINSHGVAVGFYTDAAGINHGYTYDVSTHSFTTITPPNAKSVTATGINDSGDVCGFFTSTSNSATASFVDSGGTYTIFEGPGSANTTALGINNADIMVGSYTDASNVTQGFVYQDGYIQTVNDPDAATGSTVVNGINNHLQLVGFYMDAAGNTHGFEANPERLHTCQTLDDSKDPTFNQLLGINDNNVIAGYFGSGMPGHPNKGYVLSPPYGQSNYTDENYPGSAQTQVTGINNAGATVGFYVDNAGNNFGFTDIMGHFTKVVDPKTPTATSRLAAIDQLLGINNHDIAVGFYLDKNGDSHGYEYSLAKGTFRAITPPGATSITATGINDAGAVSGFFTEKSGTVASFLYHGAGNYTVVEFPGSTNTTALGVNNRGQMVGSYVDSAGLTHGFLYTNGTFQSIDDPNGVGTTVINGVNNATDLVGFYVDSNGNTDGFLATPQ